MVATRTFVPGTISSGNIIIGGPSTGQIQDSGLTPFKTFISSSDPGVGADISQGYVAGSLGLNTATGRAFVCKSNGLGAAVWNVLSPAVPLGFGSGTIAAATTWYEAGGQASGANQNFANIAPSNGIFSNLYFRTAASPGAALTYIATLYVGAPAVMSATALTCTISGASATTANDTTHSVAISAGQAWAVQTVTSAGATATGQHMISMMFQPT